MSPASTPTVLPVLSDTTPNEVCVTLYFERPPHTAAAAPRLRAQLSQAVGDWKPLNEVPTGSQSAAIYEARQPPRGFASLYLLAFDSTFSLHTEVVQLILSSHEPNNVAWPQAADWLTGVLSPTLSPQLATKAFLGYTIVYRANANSDASTALPLDPVVLQSVRSIHQPGHAASSKPRVLAQQPVMQGQLYLVEYPKAPAQGLVYVALGQAGRSTELADAVFASPSATLVTQDIFVHKALSQSWAVNIDYDTYDTNRLTPFKNSITNLLQVVDNPQLKTRQLNDFAQQLASVTQTQWDLNRLEHSLQQQLNGLRRQFAHTELPAIARHHLTTLESHWQEVQALVRQHHLVLENARAAISLAEAQENKHANARQQRFNQLIALGGILFAAFSAIDKDFVQILDPAASCLRLYALRFGLALAAVLVFAVLYGGYKIYRQKSRSQQAKRRSSATGSTSSHR